MPFLKMKEKEGRDCVYCKKLSWALMDSMSSFNSSYRSCNCSATGTIGGSCDATTGVCFCATGATGRTCGSCLPGYFANSTGYCQGILILVLNGQQYAKWYNVNVVVLSF